MLNPTTLQRLVFYNLKWSLLLVLLFLILWSVVFIQEKSIALPVVEKISVKSQHIDSFATYIIHNSRNIATLEVKANIIKRLFFARPILNLDFSTCLYFTFIVFVLYRVTLYLGKSMYFKKNIYKSFYWLGFSTLIYYVIQSLAEIQANIFVTEITQGKYMPVHSFFNYFYLVIPLCYLFLVVGYCLKKGFSLQHEQELTI